MDELLEQFLSEGRDLVAQAAADLASLSADPSDRGAIDSAFRAIHTLKGSVGIFPMGPAEAVLHAAEDALERARQDGTLDGGAIPGLTACIDLVDRWIDQVETSGTVDAAAERDGHAAIARLPAAAAAAGAAAENPPAADTHWIGALAERERELLDGATDPLVAFRYAPDADCFFRGDDPLAIVAGVPGLVALSVLPAAGAWPELDTLEPFSCISVIEGISTAALEDVRGAFRLVADQVSCHVVAPRSAEAAPEPAGSGAGQALRVDAGRIDALADDLGELIVAANALGPLVQRAARHDRALAADLRGAQARIDGRIAALQRSVGGMRLVPLAPTLRRLPRLVREIAESLDKPVTLSLSGETLEVDKAVAEALFEPLLHLVRNAVDHGIEDAATREAAGKPPHGTVTLAVRREGDTVLITVADDGAGMDPARLRAVAVERGLLAPAAAAELSDAAALRLIFTPGFSTARGTTAVSGRGVGMDAVQRAVDKLRGTIAIDADPGQGTRFALRLPAHALTTRLLVVAAGEDRYGVALDQIVETARVDADALMPVGDGLACVLRGRTVPVLSLAQLLGGTQRTADHATLLVTRVGAEQVALRVDGFAERLDTVVRPPSGLLAALPGIGGSALLGDGGVLLVLNLQALAA